MMFVYNWKTLPELEAEQDDPGAREMSLEDFSRPELCGIRRAWTPRDVEEVRARVLHEVDPGDMTQDTVRWETDDWEFPERGRPSQVHRLLWGDNLVATMVVLIVEAD